MSILLLQSVALSVHIYDDNVNESEKQEATFSVCSSASNIHDVDGVECQLVCKSTSERMIQLQQVC